MRYGFIGLALLAGLAGAIGDSFLNHWAKKTPHWAWLIGGIVLWNLSLVPFVYMLKKGLLTESVIAFLLCNSILVALMSTFTFQEQASMGKWFWMAIGLLALIMMEKS